MTRATGRPRFEETALEVPLPRKQTGPDGSRPAQVLFVQGGGEGTHDSWDDKLVASLRTAAQRLHARRSGSNYSQPPMSAATPKIWVDGPSPVPPLISLCRVTEKKGPMPTKKWGAA